MSQDIHHLARLLASFFNAAELRHFIGSLDIGDDLLLHLPSGSASLGEFAEAAASFIDRWGISDAELFVKLHRQRPTRLAELLAYHRARSTTPTTMGRRTISLEMNASIDGSPVGVYRLRPGQVKSIGRSSEAEIQFPIELIKLSRLHAWTFWPPCGPTIQDLDSKNGTYLNGRRIQRAPLHQGDQVQLGEIRLQIHEPDRTETAVFTANDTLV